MDHREQRIIVETGRHRITGSISLPVEGYRSRLSDYLNASERVFVALTDVEVVGLGSGERAEHRPFVVLSLRHIVLAMPVEEQPPD